MVRTIVIFSCVFVLSIQSFAAEFPSSSAISRVVVTADNTESNVITFETDGLFPQQVQLDGGSNDVLLLPGEGMLLEQGMPILPSINRFVIVPADRALEFSYQVENSHEISGENQPVLFDEEGAGALMGLNYGGQTLYPPVAAEMSEPIIIRGVRMVKVTAYPVQYNASTNNYIINEGIETQINYVNGEPVNPVINPLRRHRSKNFKKYIDALVINPEANRRDAFEEATINNGHYLIVTHESCLEYAASFIEWRRKGGYKVDILSLSSNDARSANNVKREIQILYDEYIDNGEDPFDNIHLIGDRGQYTYAGQANWILEADRGHADYVYALLEGDDDHPDVGVARWPNGSRQMMELVVGKTLAYEAEPYMEDPSWFRRGAVYTQHWGNNGNSAWHQSIIVGPRWAEEVMKQHGVDNVWAYEDMEWDQFALRLGEDIVDRYNEGTNLMFGRAELYVFTPRPPNGRINFGSLDRNVVFPIEINMSGHSEWSREIMYRTGNGDNLKGPVATSFGWNGPATTAMTVMMMEMVNGLMQRDLPYGMAYSMACTAMELSISNYNWRGQSVYSNTRLETNAFSDPGLQPWLGVPQIVSATVPEEVVQDVRLISVNVIDPENDEPVADAVVTLYAPGDLPDYDDDDYADYDEMTMLTMTSDGNGNAIFILGDDVQFDGDVIYITITGRAIVPHFSEIEIVRDIAAIELTDYSLEESEGNDDGDVNPGETFTLTLTAGNIAADGSFQDVAAVVTTTSPWIEIENGETTFGNIAAGESAEAESQITINISPLCPDGMARPSQRPEIHIEFISGEASWSSAIMLDPFAPAFVVQRVVGGIQIPTEQDDLNIEIKNVGRVDSPPIDANLITLGLGVGVVGGNADYPAIEVNEIARIDGDLFNISGNTIVVPGSITPMKLILRNRTGFVDTAYFNLQVGETRENAPFGPDKYGYVCFDNTDEDWEISPEYDWIEINPEDRNRDFDGTACDFDGRSEQDVGEVQVVNLGFTTRFYGYDYDQISIASNGFITPGAQERIVNFQNYPLDRGIGGGAGMIAPFWDWLDLNEDSGVYYYYDEDDAKFIIEWSKLRHFSAGGDDLTFQVIIYDADIWVTESGNPNIVFQYKNINNIRGRTEGTPGEKNIFFASVGISSPDGNTGLSYTFGNEYPVSCPELENQMALLFATSTEFLSGNLHGRVTDVATGEPIPVATIFTSHGMVAVTDTAGYWEIIDALAEVPFNITARLQGYNDSTYVDMFIEEDDTLEINFALLHPEFVPSTLNMQTRLDPGASRDLSFDIRNDGNGPLSWSVIPRLPGNADADPWEFREDFHFGDQLEEDKLYGVLYINDQFYISGSNKFHDEEGQLVAHPTIYIFDSDGAFIDTIAQPGEGRYGMKDMAWDGDWIWGVVDDTVYGINLEGEVMASFDSPYNPASPIAWASDRNVLWICGTVTNGILAYDREGNEIEELAIDQENYRIYGLSYFSDDPDGAPLYILHRDREENRQTLDKYNFDSDEKSHVTYLYPEEGGTPQGAFITNKYDVYSWVFMSISNLAPRLGGDRVDIHQIEGRMDWFQLDLVTEEGRMEANDGVLQTGETGEFILHFDALDLPTVEFATELHFYHNATGGHTLINGVLNVIGEMPPDSFMLATPPDSSFFEDIEVAFGWYPSNDPNEGEPVTYQLSLETGEDSYSVEIMDTTVTIRLDSVIVLREEDMVIDWWVLAMSGEDTIEAGQRFSFKLVYNAVGEDNLAPIEYGLRSIYPNPFNSVTSITFGADRSEHIRLIVYDISGREVVRLFDGVPRRGYHRLAWRADTVPTGVYLLRLESPGRSRVAKVALVK